MSLRVAHHHHQRRVTSRAASATPPPAPPAEATTAANQTRDGIDDQPRRRPPPPPQGPLAITAGPSVTLKDLLLKDERPPGAARTDRSWEPASVLLVVSRFYAQTGVLGLTSTALGEQLELGLQLPEAVVARAAQFLGFTSDELRSYLGRLPWKQLDHVEKAPVADVATSVAAMQATVGRGNLSYRPNIPVSFDQALAAVELKPDAVSLMHHWAVGVVDVETFLAQHERDAATHARDGRQGYTLGATSPADLANLRFSVTTNLRVWQEGYLKLLNGNSRHANYRPQTDNYMDLITASGEPVVFLLPPRLGRGEFPVTSAELRWLLDRPERMKNVTFVVGAYQEGRAAAE